MNSQPMTTAQIKHYYKFPIKRIIATAILSSIVMGLLPMPLMVAGLFAITLLLWAIPMNFYQGVLIMAFGCTMPFAIITLLQESQFALPAILVAAISVVCAVMAWTKQEEVCKSITG